MNATTTKVEAWVASAWYRDCDPFIRIAFAPSFAERNWTFWSLTDDLVKLISGDDEDEQEPDICWTGFHHMDIELTETELRDFESDGFVSLDV